MNARSECAPFYIEVAFDVPLRQTFTYSVPPHWQALAGCGCRIRASFGKQHLTGFIIKTGIEPAIDPQQIKAIEKVLDTDLPTFPPELLELLQWTADYYRCGIGEAAAAAYPFSEQMQHRRMQTLSVGTIPENLTPKQQRIIECVATSPHPLTLAQVAQVAEVSPSTIRSLVKQNLLRTVTHFVGRKPSIQSTEKSRDLPLSYEQEQALSVIFKAMESGGSPILMEGITGSGKTEVYLQAIRHILETGRRALVLIPEISLTPQTAQRFVSRFGEVVAVLHSGLSTGERYDEWWAVRRGERQVAIGARSAVFAPLSNLGLIVVDEEHDGSYKQTETAPRYHARDLAVMRANLCGAAIVLGSATPSLESTYNARKGKYSCVYLRQRPTAHSLPAVQLVDMRHRPKDEQVLSKELRQALQERYERNQQSILFLNRRGFATSAVCRECGYVLRCPNCSVALVYHYKQEQMICHHCDHRDTSPTSCPSCHARFIRLQGWGTEKLVELTAEALPGAVILRMDRDTTQRKDGHELILREFREGADVLIGTQMVTKGLDIPNVTLVGIVNADGSLNLSDFRAAERTFSQLVQVAGRAGRGTYPGEVLIQTWCPDHYAIQLALRQDYAALYEREIKIRNSFAFPPFSRLILIRVEGQDEKRVKDLAWRLYRLSIEPKSGATVLPPLEAPIYRIRNLFRWHLALRSPDRKILAQLLDRPEVDALIERPGHGLRIVVDVDPTDTL